MTTLSASVTNTSNIKRINVSDSHGTSMATAIIEAKTTTLDIGDTITVDIGYSGNTGRVFTGYVKQKEKTVPDNLWTITAYNELVRAVDYYIASTDPNAPFTRSSIAAEDLVEDILNLAGITNYTAQATSFTFGIQTPVEVNLVSAYDFSRMISNILAWHLYADENGQVHFVDRKPYVVGGDTPVATISRTSGQILTLTNRRTERDLRNRIVCYGASGVYAEATASSPWLPASFYKTAVLATEYLDTTANAQLAANYNLTLLNRLRKEVSATLVGDWSLQPRTVVTITESDTGTSGDWYLYAVDHDFSSAGYKTTIEARQDDNNP